jgi:hypothetical protein
MNSETHLKCHPYSKTTPFERSYLCDTNFVLGHVNVSNPVFRDYPYPRPVSMSGSYQTPYKKNLSRYLLSNLSNELWDTVDNIVEKKQNLNM